MLLRGIGKVVILLSLRFDGYIDRLLVAAVVPVQTESN